MKSNILKLSVLTLALCSFTLANAQEKKKATPEKKFKRMDADKNGEVSLTEFKAKKDASKAEQLEKRFNRMDSDKNGSLSVEEFKAAIAKMKARKAKKAAKAAKESKE